MPCEWASILRAKAASSLNPQALHTCLARSTHLISAQRTKPKVNLLPANTAPACRMKPTSWPSTCVIRPCPPQTPSQTPLSPRLIPQVTPTYTPFPYFLRCFVYFVPFAISNCLNSIHPPCGFKTLIFQREPVFHGAQSSPKPTGRGSLLLSPCHLPVPSASSRSGLIGHRK